MKVRQYNANKLYDQLGNWGILINAEYIELVRGIMTTSLQVLLS
jgi:hypothetical protein